MLVPHSYQPASHDLSDKLALSKMALAQKRLLTQGWLSHIDPAIAKTILDSGRISICAKGKVLFSVEDDAGGVLGIVSGSVILSAAGHDDGPVPGHIMRQTRWFGYGPALLSQPRTLLAQANEETVILHLSLAAINRLRDLGTDYGRAFSLLPKYGEAVLLAIIADLLIPDSERRLAAVLLRVTDAGRGQNLPVEPLPLTQELLGQLANASRQTVGRFVRKARKERLIEWRYGKVTVLDAHRLQALASGT